MPRYATTTDLVRLGLPSTALTSVSSTTQEAALDAASSLADGYIASRKKLPLSAWGDDLRTVVARLAAYDLMVTRGYDPAAGRDDQLRLRHEDAMRWLRDFADGRIDSPSMVDATPDDTSDEATVYASSARRRRWVR